MNPLSRRPRLTVRRGECLVIVTDRDGSCEIHPVKRVVGDGPTDIRDGLSAVLDKNDAHESALFGTVFYVSAEEGRSVRYRGTKHVDENGKVVPWSGPSASRIWRAKMDVRAKDVARVEPEGLFGFLTKAMPVMILFILLMMGWMVVQGVMAI